MYPGNMRNKSRIMSLAYLREIVVSFHVNEPRPDTHSYAKDNSHFDFSDMLPHTSFFSPNINRESGKACMGEDTISLEYYIAYLLRILGYARIWPVESFSRLKTLLSTGATIVFISANSLLLFSEIVALTMNNDLKLFANIIGVIGMHAVGLIKWCYCLRKNREIIDIVAKLEKCHVLCQKIDKSEEGTRISYLILLPV